LGVYFDLNPFPPPSLLPSEQLHLVCVGSFNTGLFGIRNKINVLHVKIIIPSVSRPTPPCHGAGLCFESALGVKDEYTVTSDTVLSFL